MCVAKYFIIVLLVLLARINIVFSIKCTQITETSGTIKSSKRASTYSKCWRFSLPEESTVKIEMVSFYSDNDNCLFSKVEVSLSNEEETYTFCPRQRYEPLNLNGDFTVTHIMESQYSPFFSEFSLNYIYENLPCSEVTYMECSDDGTCFFESSGCSATEECSGGEYCSSRTFFDPSLTENRAKGIAWLMKKWSYTTGWKENTHRGITALFLSRERNEKKVNVEEELMVKQLEVQTFAYISKKETNEMTLNQLSMFVNALTVSCLDPFNFYGNDLVKLLTNSVELSSATTTAVAYLALCNAGVTLPGNATKDLSNLLRNNEDSFLFDVQAAAVMALSCIKANEHEALNSIFPQTDYDEAIRKFKALQLENGSFGSIYTTAIITQALLSAAQENNTDWNYNKAINHLIQHLKLPSADFLSVYLILPILNRKCLSHIRNTNCSTRVQRDSVDEVKNMMGSKMRVQYTLNIGDEKDIIHTISLRVPENITVFEVMQLAQDADAKYKFQGKYMGKKLYIYNIAGIINDFEDDKFWLLYVGKDAISIKYTSKSPDKITLEDENHVVMWYKKAHI